MTLLLSLLSYDIYVDKLYHYSIETQEENYHAVFIFFNCNFKKR